MAVIAFKSVSKAYSGKTALHDFSLIVETGQRVVIVGPSGCGKTTVLRLLAGFIAPDTGTISIDGHVVSADGKISSNRNNATWAWSSKISLFGRT